MTIQSATRVATTGLWVSLGIVTLAPPLFRWAYAHSGLPTNSVGIVQEICYHISDLFLYGGLLIFFTTLMSRQKNRLP